MGPLLYTEGVGKSDRLLEAVLQRPEDVSVAIVYVEPEEVCFRCDRGDLPLERCAHCHHEVCPGCATIYREAIRCRVCA